MGLFEDNEKLKLAKAVVNHTKTVANEYIEKHSKPTPDINEDKIYENVMLEIEEDKKVKSTWARALAQSEGDDKKAQSLYIKLRVSELVQKEKDLIEKHNQYMAFNIEHNQIQKLNENKIFNELNNFEPEKDKIALKNSNEIDTNSLIKYLLGFLILTILIGISFK